MSKFKVGDRVKVRSDLKTGETPCGLSVWSDMAQLAGQTVTIKTVGVAQYGDMYTIDGSSLRWSNDCFDGIASNRHEIHITCTDNKTTHAVKKVDGKIVARSRADCCSADEFDFAVGAKLAYDRLMRPETLEKAQPEQPKQEDKPTYKVGDKVKVIGNGNPITHYADVGSVQTVRRVFSDSVEINECFQTISFADIEPYTEPESTEPKQEPEKAEPEYYSGKVVCVEATDRGVTLGKVYTVEKGVFTWNSGKKSDTKATTIEQFNNCFIAAKFIEFKGE